MKYLGVILYKKLLYQQEVKQILSKIAQGIKTLYVLRNVVPYHLRKILLNSLVISHLQYSAVLLSSLSKNFMSTLEEQLNWAVKACFFQRFKSSSFSIKLDNYILPIKQLLENRTALYVNQLLTFKKPAFRRLTGLSLPTYKFYRHSRTKTIFLEERSKTSWLNKSIIRGGLSFNNCLEKNLKGNESNRRVKKVFKNYFFQQFQKDPMGNTVGNISWKAFKFN